ncbi:MAG: hypothetical protein AAB632_02890 [Patescibacteria group bacterium]|mgnify:CR=1 FL=1
MANKIDGLEKIKFESDVERRFFDCDITQYKGQTGQEIAQIAKDERNVELFLLAARRLYEANEGHWLFVINLANYTSAKGCNALSRGDYKSALKYLSDATSLVLFRYEECYEKNQLYLIEDTKKRLDGNLYNLLLSAYSKKIFDSKNQSEEKSDIYSIEYLIDKKLWHKIQSLLGREFETVLSIALFETTNNDQFPHYFLCDISKNLQNIDNQNPYIDRLKFSLRKYQKLLRKKVFKKDNFLKNKDELREICCAFKILTTIGKNVEGGNYYSYLDEVEYLKYKAYLEESRERAEKHFDEALKILKANRADDIEVELMLGRKNEFLSIFEKDRNKKIKYYKEASSHFTTAHSPKSYMMNLLIELTYMDIAIKDKDIEYLFTSTNTLIADYRKSLSYIDDSKRIYEKLILIKYYLQSKEAKLKMRDIRNLLSNDNKKIASMILSLDFFKKSTLEIDYQKSEFFDKAFLMLLDKNGINVSDISGFDSSERINLGKILVENSATELKGSMDMRLEEYFIEGKKMRGMIEEFLRSIAGFWNAEGGKLYVGVLENKKIYEENFEKVLKKHNAIEKIKGKQGELLLLGSEFEFGEERSLEKFTNKAADLIGSSFSNEIMSMRICRSINEIKVNDNNTIIEIDIEKGDTPAFLGDKLYIRRGASEVEVKADRLVRYLNSRFPDYY